MAIQQKLTALIVDDEFHARENLRMLLQEFCPEVNVLESAGTVEEGRKKILELQPQIVFLDIRMPSGAEGFDLLDSLEEKNFMVVFVTAFKDYAIRAFNANAIHYILKPIDIEDLQSAVNKLVEYHESFLENHENFLRYMQSISELSAMVRSQKKPQRITLYHTRGFRIVNQEDIVHLEAENNCTMLFFRDGTKYLDTKTLKIFEETLPDDDFMRIHKSHIVNMNCISEYLSHDGGLAVMKDGYHVPVSRNKLSEFLSRLKR
ncbi:MAG: LytTR family DNA-binding domain-containing protein [Flavobacteriales bacterium]|nr:LytTR family DNA-binding domain-containing protein [Flavobacteriales bacterium]